MKFKCEVDMNNAAFLEPLELTLILEKIADQHYHQGVEGSPIYDSNGNKVGQWEIEE